jgi:hypothetical protein
VQAENRSGEVGAIRSRTAAVFPSEAAHVIHIRHVTPRQVCLRAGSRVREQHVTRRGRVVREHGARHLTAYRYSMPFTKISSQLRTHRPVEAREGEGARMKCKFGSRDVGLGRAILPKILVGAWSDCGTNAGTPEPLNKPRAINNYC